MAPVAVASSAMKTLQGREVVWRRCECACMKGAYDEGLAHLHAAPQCVSSNLLADIRVVFFQIF